MGIPLTTQNGTLVTSRSLTYAIYWSPKKMPDALSNGHATVIIDSAAFWADQIGTNNSHWRLGDSHATVARNQLVWWPTDVHRSARSMTGIIALTS